MFTDGDRYKYSVLESAQGIAGEVSGSGSAFAYDGREFRDRVAWLDWRVNAGWIECRMQRMSEYENAVRAMAKAAVLLGIEFIKTLDAHEAQYQKAKLKTG
jgi:hypothetical protein